MAKFRDMPEWGDVKKDLANNTNLDEAAIASIGEEEGDSLDFVETVMALEEAFPKRNRRIA